MQKEKKKIWLMILGGIAVGFANGFFGGGGGMIAVPLLIGAFHLPKKKAHATALAVILPLSVISGAIYLTRGAAEIPVLIGAGAGVLVGGIIGALLLKKIPNETLAPLFYFIMIVAGAVMIFF